MKELWKDIKGYEGLYMVSNKGRVKSLARKVKGGNNIRTVEERILTPNKTTHGYVQVTLCKNNKQKHINIHRLVALHFIPNDDPLNKTEVNHKDEDKTNNCVTNLEWCTPKYNINYGTCKERIRNANKGKQNNGSKKASEKAKKKIICITDNNKQFDSIREAAKYYNIKSESNLSKCARGDRKVCGKLADGTPLEWKLVDNSEVND